MRVCEFVSFSTKANVSLIFFHFYTLLNFNLYKRDTYTLEGIFFPFISLKMKTFQLQSKILGTNVISRLFTIKGIFLSFVTSEVKKILFLSKNTIL